MAAQHPAQQGAPSLLSLPLELRHLVYDYLLEPLKVRPAYDDIYVLPHEYPVHDFSTYRTLQLTDKQLHNEVTHHFRILYLPLLTVYFVDDVPTLYNFSQKLAKAPDHIFYRIHFSLVNRCRLAALGDSSSSQTAIVKPSTALIRRHCNYDFDTTWDPDWARREEDGSWWTRGDECQRLTLTRGQTEVSVVRPPKYAKPVFSDIDVLLRELEDISDSYYVEVRGKVRDLNWDDYEAESAEEDWRHFACGGQRALGEDDLYTYAEGMETLVAALDDS
ncbi:hypothetical protein LTR36_001224 [Oleoguttula mirabilis]|uniref:Uncharacterized protein n=1 Tax=Oleoguttula mirabilis TaxID=1507867 RepID=A0AAV9JR31_9PEZI|nr:hypothetical protein LTR36_001224 [Oleoguttula mirabilis]